MLSIHQLSHHIGSRTLYKDITWQINPQDKIGLVGLNGVGKSTLLHLIAGHQLPDKGTIRKSKDCTIGFLTQDLLTYQTDKSIKELALEALGPIVELQRELDQILHQLEKTCTQKLLDRLGLLQDQLANQGGYEAAYQVEKVLAGIGFDKTSMDKPFSSFSGGWRMRVLLAQLLLKKPTFLLLDEPTNHLDVVAIEWLESYLQTYKQAVVIVSHDRHFLDNTTKKTVEIANTHLHIFKGNYSYYEKEKARLAVIEQQSYANQQKHIQQTTRFIERFRSKASKARQVQSRIKALEKMTLVANPTQSVQPIKLHFGQLTRSSAIVAHIENVYKAFGEKLLLADASATIQRGEKIALIGANGQGKSTILRLLAGMLPPDEGQIKLGTGVKIGFYTQHQLEALTPTNTLLEELQQKAPEKSITSLRSTLGAFLFSNEDAFKKIKVLSGGEKARIALAKLLVTQANFLLLDEPTNHLDMLAISILTSTLATYPGTIISVSHNRHFISQTATQIWYIEEGQIKVYPGNYNSYLAFKKEK